MRVTEATASKLQNILNTPLKFAGRVVQAEYAVIFPLMVAVQLAACRFGIRTIVKIYMQSQFFWVVSVILSKLQGMGASIYGKVACRHMG